MNDTPTSAANPAKTKLTPSAIHRYLDQYVVGQDEAKRALSVVVYTHFKNAHYQKTSVDENLNSHVALGKSNVLLVGPTGTGKTLLCDTLSRAINVPFVTADATSLAQTKFMNEEIESILQRLVNKADGDLARAERGIVFIDEIDKLKAAGTEARSTSGESVQHALLKIMEGSLVKLAGGSGNGVAIDTTNIMFICGGAFVGLDQIVKHSKAYGFISVTDNNNQKILDRLNSRIKPTDLMSFGLIPEFTGRLPVVASLQPLTQAMLVSIMTVPKNCLYNQFREVFKREGCELKIEARVFDEIAALAVEYKVGARSLRGIFEEMIAPVLFVLPDQNAVKTVRIRSLFEDAEMITD
jgi:ATP-dependent Clp protease ATP-binding subunit ClpX